jgi:hypothetical protein
MGGGDIRQKVLTMIQSPRNKSLMGKAVGAYHVEDYDSTNFTRRNKSKWSNVGGALDGGGVGASARPIRNLYRGEGYVFNTSGVGSSFVGGSRTSVDVPFIFDFKIRTVVAPTTSWSVLTLGSTSSNAGGQLQVNLVGTGAVRLRLTTGGTSATTRDFASDVGLFTHESVFQWIRVHYRPNVSGQDVADFYISTDGETWNLHSSQSRDAVPRWVGLGLTNFGGSFNFVNGPQALAKFRWFEDGVLVVNFNGDLCGQTGYTDTTTSPSTTWVINRTGSGLKHAVVNRNTGSHSLYGGNRFAEVADHPALNFGAGEAFTVASVVRRFGPVASGNQFINRKGGFPDARWGTNWGTTNLSSSASDGSVLVIINQSYITGNKDLLGTRSNGSTLHVINNGLGPSAADSSGDKTSTSPFRVGRDARDASSTSYADMEETLTAIFRRALTPFELTRLKWESETFARKF